MKFIYLPLCITMLLISTHTWSEPLGYEKREMGKGPKGNTPTMQFFDAAEQDAQDKYATIIDPADNKEQVEEQEQQADSTSDDPKTK